MDVGVKTKGGVYTRSVKQVSEMSAVLWCFEIDVMVWMEWICLLSLLQHIQTFVQRYCKLLDLFGVI